MANQTVWSVYFSPSGTTEKVVERIAAGFPGERRKFDLLREPEAAGNQFRPEDVVIVGMPVFAGRIPAPCAEALKAFRGSTSPEAKTPVIAVVVYGNREFDDALLELKTILEEQGFAVIGAAAFVAQHSIFPKVAEGRPDSSDLEKADAFAAGCVKKWREQAGSPSPLLNVKGNTPFREASAVPLKPSADSSCNGCGVCVSTCPVHAIRLEDPQKTDKQVCISCTACIAACPRHARKFRGPMYAVAEANFRKKCAERKEPQIYL